MTKSPKPKPVPLRFTADLTRSQRGRIPFDVRDGIANPDDARALLAWFCHCAEYNLPIPPTLTEHLRVGFGSYLDGSKTLDAALGLKRKVGGRRTADPTMRLDMAADVLRRRLTGTPHQRALNEVSDKFGWAESIVGEAWRDHRLSAVALVNNERAAQWTGVEKRVLQDILKDQPVIDGCTGKIAALDRRD
jgi:hypothetical protein